MESVLFVAGMGVILVCCALVFFLCAVALPALAGSVIKAFTTILKEGGPR